MVSTWVDDRLLCRRPRCSSCASAPEFIAVHYDCYRIFSECSGQASKQAPKRMLDRLWIVSSWRKPWPKAQIAHLTEETIDPLAFSKMAGVSGLPQLCKLPPELVSMIRDLSHHELLWRSISVVALSSKKPQVQTYLKVPLDRILPWRRGEPFMPASSSLSLPSHVRFTIDCQGISKVERLHEWPLYNDDRPRGLVFIVGRIDDMPGVYTEFKVRPFFFQLCSSNIFKDGRLRLCLPRDRPGLQIWNTQNPPHPTTCKLLNPATSRFLSIRNLSSQLYAIDLTRSRGLTFFFSSGKLCGIHTHRSEYSSALDTYERFPLRSRRRMVWIHVPIAQNDQVLALGSRKTNFGFNVLVS